MTHTLSLPAATHGPRTSSRAEPGEAAPVSPPPCTGAVQDLWRAWLGRNLERINQRKPK